MSTTHEKYDKYLADQREFFDELVTNDWETYDDPWWDRVRRDEVRRLFREVSPSSVLDVGCGCGFHDVEMAAMPGVERVVGIDYSERSIEAAEREYPHRRVERRVADVFGPATETFDLVVSFQVIEHLEDAEGFLAACRDRATPGGWVAVATPNRDRLQNRWRRLRGKPPTMIDPQHFREWNASELRALGESVGMRPGSAFGYGLSFRVPRLRLTLMPKRLGHRLGAAVPAAADVLCQTYEVPRGG